MDVFSFFSLPPLYNAITAKIVQLKDGLAITDSFNHYLITLDTLFTNSGLPSDPVYFHDLTMLLNYISDKIPDDSNFTIEPITSSSLLRYLKNLDISKGTGLDGLEAKLLKLSALIIADSLTKIRNTCILTGDFPSQWKSARVTYLHKSGSTIILTNYRPIFILLILSKVCN